MIKNYFLLARPHQYVKNILIFSPLFFAGQIYSVQLLLNTFIAFLAFSATASAIYCFNDIQDIEEDRQHPKKKSRPLVLGNISSNQAIMFMIILLFIGILLLAKISFQAVVILVIYILLNIGYSLYLKHIAILDITVIATGFVLRLLIGSTVTNIPLSKWIVIITFLLAIFLALSKRRDDVLELLNTGKKMRKVVDGYNLQFIDGAMMIMASVVIVGYILYTTSIEISNQVRSEYLYITALFVILSIIRYLQIVIVQNICSSPTEILFKDKFLQIMILLWVIFFVWMIYY